MYQTDRYSSHLFEDEMACQGNLPTKGIHSLASKDPVCAVVPNTTGFPSSPAATLMGLEGLAWVLGLDVDRYNITIINFPWQIKEFI